MPIPAVSPLEVALELFNYVPKDLFIDALWEAARVGPTPTPIPINEVFSVTSSLPV